MANLRGIQIKKQAITGNTNLGTDSTSALVITGIASSGLALDTAVEIKNLKQAENLGITAEYDKTNNLNVYRHLSEFFRLAGDGVSLWLMLVAQTKTLSELCVSAKTLLVESAGEVRQVALAINLESSTTITLVDGIPQEVGAAIADAQTLADWAGTNDMPCVVVLEGYAYGGSSSASLDLRQITNVEAPNVSVFIGQDYDYAATKTGHAQKYADVGTLLGVLAIAGVYQNIGNNELFNLSTGGQWKTPGISSHQTNKSIYADLQTLEDKAYLFGLTYTGLSGVRINNDYTCVAVKNDTENNVNEHTLAYSRVMQKAVRGLRAVYLPKVKTDWLVDAKTGKLSKGTIASLEDLGDAVFEGMIGRGEVSYGKTTVDPDSDLVVKKELLVSFVIVPKGSINEIKGTINLKSKV